MLARKERLRKSRCFDSVYRKGNCHSSKDLLVYILPNDLTYQRCGFSISKKVSKKAVERNKLKRRLSFIFREESKKIIPNLDIVFVARKSLIDFSFAELTAIVQKLLEKAKLYSL
jgi:ribonuclease P protein component